jgi:hypothetical protein
MRPAGFSPEERRLLMRTRSIGLILSDRMAAAGFSLWGLCAKPVCRR